MSTTRSKTVCKQCGYAITWASQKKQFARLAKLGFQNTLVKICMPRCGSCVTRFIKICHD